MRGEQNSVCVGGGGGGVCAFNSSVVALGKERGA